MSWLDTLLDRGNEAGQLAAPAAPMATPRQAAPEIKSLWVQTRTPRDAIDPGGCEAGYYSVADGVLTMHDESGKPTGQEYRLGPGDDARQVAGRLALKAIRKARGQTDFNRPLGYAPFGNA